MPMALMIYERSEHIELTLNIERDYLLLLLHFLA